MTVDCTAPQSVADELRLAFGQEEMVITCDGEAQPAPGRDLYRPTVEAVLTSAGVRVWPWTKAACGKQLDFELAEQRSRWNLESSDINCELILKRIRTENQ